MTAERAPLPDQTAPDCLSCGETDEQRCSSSQAPCGHHCNHSWSHDKCCWCDMEWGETMAEQHITRADVARMHDTPMGCNWPRYRKRHLTQAMRMEGPFTVETREGVLTCPNGYLALDSQGWPYPIAADEFDAIYESVESSRTPDEERRP